MRGKFLTPLLVLAGVLFGSTGVWAKIAAEDSWTFHSWGAAAGWIESNTTYRGSTSLGLQGLNGGWERWVPVQPGLIHSLQFKYRSENAKGRIVLYVRIPKSGGGTDTIVYLPKKMISSNQSGTFVDGIFIGGADTNGWVSFDGGTFVPDAGVTNVNVLIKLRGSQTNSMVLLDGLEIRAEPVRLVPETAELLSSNRFGWVWSENVNRKVLPDRTPPVRSTIDGLSLAVARGEYESFQLVATPLRNWAGVEWRWKDFSGPGELLKEAIRCRKVEWVNITTTLGPYAHEGLNPDPLSEALPCSVSAHSNQTFWFTLKIPEDLPPGMYKNELVFVADNEEVTHVPLQVRVYDFKLPGKPSIDTRSNFRSGLVLAREQGRADQILHRYYQNFFAHRTACPPGVGHSVTFKGNTATLKMDRLVEHLRYMREEFDARGFFISALWVPHKEHKLPVDARWKGRTIFADPSFTKLTPNFEEAFRDYLEKFTRRLKEEGLFLNPIIKFIDEPNLDDPDTVVGIRTLAELILDIDQGWGIRTAANYPHPELTDVIKFWNIHTDAWTMNLAATRAAQEKGCHIGVYNNATNLPEHRFLRTRLWPWLLWKYGVDASLSWWGTVKWVGPMENPWAANESSSGVLLYPPRLKGEIGPIDSIRWELFREGLEDYEYLHLAHALVKRLMAANRPDEAQQGIDAIRAAMELVEAWPNVKAQNDEPYSVNPVAVMSAREQLAKAIVKMQSSLGLP